MNFKNKDLLSKKTLLCIGFIFILGLFLRTYNYAQWLRFNDDQSRDALLMINIAKGNASIPLLGPRAAQTDFKLGPIYYYFQYIASKIFGATPVSIAIPDLIFSMLSIPLFFLFARKYFTQRNSIILMLLFSVSFFVVSYSRFAWNPNSVPFFALLFFYSLLELISEKENNKTLWASLVGLSFGIGVQLHTLFLVVAPVVLIGSLIYFSKKNLVCRKSIAIIFSLAILLNITQIYSEIKTGGKNTRAFFASDKKESPKSKSIPENFVEDLSCQARENSMILSSYGGVVQCSSIGLINPVARFNNGSMNLIQVVEWVVGLIFIVVFHFGGCYFLIRQFRKEKNQEKRIFLGLILVYYFLIFVILIPLAFGIPNRFFLVVEFIPFILFGLWLEFFDKIKYGSKAKILLVVFLILLNLNSFKFAADRFSGKNLNLSTPPEDVSLNEVKLIADYIKTNSAQSGRVSVLDKSGEVFGMTRALAYFLSNDKIAVLQVTGLRSAEAGSPYFVITLVGQNLLLDEKNEKIENQTTLGRFTVYKIKK